jgi:PhoPQ-activated pathogenicity-related protein
VGLLRGDAWSNQAPPNEERKKQTMRKQTMMIAMILALTASAMATIGDTMEEVIKQARRNGIKVVTDTNARIKDSIVSEVFSDGSMLTMLGPYSPRKP